MKVSRIGIFVSFLSLVACQPTLWGAPPPRPTLAPPTATLTLALTATVPVTNTSEPTITAAPTPIVLNAAQVWASPAVPSLLMDKFRQWGFQVMTGDQKAESLYVDVAQPAPGAMHVSTWTYALVAPFPTLVDTVSSQDLLDFWKGSQAGPFAGIPLLMENSTKAALTQLWGAPADGVVQVVDASALLDTAWSQMPSWAIIPFEQIEPKWKVLMVDGQSPIQKSFDPSKYPLIATYRLMCADPCQVPGELSFSFENRDPSKMTTLIMTGVTALTRATAKKMDQNGVLYPGEVLRDMFLEADVLHINNEVPFYAGCPPPDPHEAKQVFCSAPRYIDLLTDIGTDVMELSGDHFADYGEEAMYETIKIYNQVHIPYYGGGLNEADGKKPFFMEVNGNKLMFIGCNYKTIYASARENIPGAVRCDFNYITDQIRKYRAEGYLPISTFQYHEFPSPEARPQQVIDFHAMSDAGALIVSGSQAHVPQVMEFNNGGFIHYGLGNLFFDQMDPEGSRITQHEFIDRHVFYDGKYLGVELITAYLEDYSRPRFMTELERNRFLALYFKLSGWNFPQAGQ
ncbi:MAG: CapA family protein [Anaerolineales bacterium]